MADIRVTQENPTETAATELIKVLSAELKALYPNSHGGDGAGAFKQQDVMIPRATFVVAWDGDKPVGCGALRPMDEPEIAEVKRMFVLPEARGKGISRAILAALENQAREFGYKTLRLETGLHQKEAMGLYASSGYQLIPCYGIYANEPLSCCYEKSLL